MTRIEALFSTHEVATRSGVEVAFVERLVKLGVIDPHPHEQQQTAFEREVTLRVAKLVRLQRDLGVNLEGAAVIIELLDRIDMLEHRLRHLERR
jgi:DNA-binding transcriptional MerR regulator